MYPFFYSVYLLYDCVCLKLLLLIYVLQREPVLKQELSRVRNANRSFHWRTQIWFPHHWNVRKVFQGESEIVPTVISRTSSSLAQPRSDPNQVEIL